MGFRCGIVGLPNVGKSTLFNALTETNKAEAANYPFATIEPNVGRVTLADKRLELLSKIEKSQKVIPTYMDFVDIAGLVKGAANGEGLGNKFLSHIREVDAIVHVVRCFEDKNITHIENKISPKDDIEIIQTELKLADLEMLSKKKNNLEKKSKSGDKDIKEQLEIIRNLEKKIDNGESFNNIEFSEKNISFYKSLNLISSKPILYVCNVDESSILSGNKLSEYVYKKSQIEFNTCVNISASIESQLAEFKDENEKKEILNSLGLKETALNKIVHAGYELLNLKTFFTCGPKETRAWTINNNSKAPEAAGKIHTDFQKGFIRAETISYEDFINYNGESGAREAGKLRLEGKEYIVQDGDVIHFLFNN